MAKSQNSNNAIQKPSNSSVWQNSNMHPYIEPDLFGVSFSLKQCDAFGIDQKQTLDWLIKDAGFRRFRLMSYWNEHEKIQGKYDFSKLDAQVEQISRCNGQISLCVGARQPRWPENHWPDWAWKLQKNNRTTALLSYLEMVINRYKSEPSIVSWQLENEALLKSFGKMPEIDRNRLKDEFKIIKQLDPLRPIIMSTSDGWGVPIRQPIPDIVGFSYYTVIHKNDAYHRTVHSPLLNRIRKSFIDFWWDRPCFIHELQCEPWGPSAIWKMPIAEQDNSMDAFQIAKNIAEGRKINAYPIDLWGAEWWYWRLHVHDDPSIWHAVQTATLT